MGYWWNSASRHGWGLRPASDKRRYPRFGIPSACSVDWMIWRRILKVFNLTRRPGKSLKALWQRWGLPMLYLKSYRVFHANIAAPPTRWERQIAWLVALLWEMHIQQHAEIADLWSP